MRKRKKRRLLDAAMRSAKAGRLFRLRLRTDK